jgi:hypothetical protein
MVGSHNGEQKAMKARLFKPICITVAAAAVAALSVPVPVASGGGNNGNNNVGRLSPASLDLDTCGCPTTFGDSYCETWTEWSLDKTTESGPFTSPNQEPFSFTVTVTEGETRDVLIAEGTIRITNSGAQTPTLANVAVLLEDLCEGCGDAPGPSGNNWSILAVTAENEHPACGNQAVTCDGVFDQTDGANLILYQCGDLNDTIALSDGVEIPPAEDEDGDGKRGEDPALDDITGLDQNCWGIFDNDFDGLLDEDPGYGAETGIDNDGDGAIDEDPIDGIDNDGDGAIDEDDPDDDGDGLVDEDGPDDDRDGLIDEDGDCDDLVEFCFYAEFPAPDVGPGDGVVPSPDDLRIDLLVTFKGGGKRGGTCELDVDCDGVLENGKQGNPDEGEGHVRTVQQRLRFDPPDCDPQCQSVTLEDLGAYSLDPDCAVVDSTTTLDEVIYATGVEGTFYEYFITGTVSCVCDSATHQVPDLAGLEENLPDQAALSVTYPYGGGPSYFPHMYITNGGDLDGDYYGWCVDTDHTINENTNYTVNVYSSYEALPAGLVEYPENLDLVNYILNQGYVGTPSPGCSGNYTYGDLQRAIWALVEDNQSTSGLGSWSQCRVDEILADANANGEGFVPDCEEEVAVIFAPVGGQQVVIAQVVMTTIPQSCTSTCPPCDTMITNCATLTCDDDTDHVEGSPACASFDVSCDGDGGGDGFCTWTQGGWGQNNPAANAFLDDFFGIGGIYEDGLFVGDTDPENDCYGIGLSSIQAVKDYLPCQGGDCGPGPLTDDQLEDPQTTSSGNLGTQLVTSTLNVTADPNLLDLIYVGGCEWDGNTVPEYFDGWTVAEVIALANDVIQGEHADCPNSGLPAGVTYSDVTTALDTLNNNFVDCEVDLGCLELPQQ